ncbi:MAG TPA: cyanophycin synthetase [Planctomycetota bacterium]|nr:cyanophycin synthetase [Planctomycetota bacterium]
MKIRSIRTLHGPNVFHDRPVLAMTLDLGDLAAVESSRVPGFVGRLTTLLPGLAEHRCSTGRKGGFVERLERGTYLAHIVEHVALELSGPAGIEVGFGKTVHAGEPGVYRVAVRFVSESGMRELLEGAVAFVEALLEGRTFDLAPLLERARRVAERDALGPSTAAIVRAAERRGIPTRRIGTGSLVQLGYGKNLRMIRAAMTSRTSSIAVDLACDKAVTKDLLRRALIPVPRGSVVETLEEAREALRALGGVGVVKPLDGNQGKGISIGVRDATLARAFELARDHGPDVIVEELYEGRDYRVLVVAGRVVAASERRPPCVTGDGETTLRELVRRENENPLRGEGHEKPLTRIPLDEVTVECLARRGRSLDDVPDAGESVCLRQTANLSTGGTARDVTAEVHPHVRLLCERAAAVVGLDVAGIDLVLPDIARPPTRGGVLEVNASPGLRMHLAPTEGAPRDPGGAIVESLYPDEAPSRIPIVSVTGTNGKTTTTRLVAHLAASLGRRIGVTTSAGVFVDGVRIADGDTTGPASAAALLSDPTVELAVLETARGGIVRRGLGYDWSDVGVITNVQADHLGQDGHETVEDLVRVKAIVAERVHEGGTLVVNADCPNALAILDSPRVARLRRNVVLVSIHADDARVRAHVAKGGTAFLLEDGWLVEVGDGESRRVARVAAIPLTLAGTALHQVSNALAALAAARAIGVPVEDAARALATFDGSIERGGRCHLYDVHGGLLLVDYGHNPEAVRATALMVRRWGARRATVVIAAPGDRSDALVAEVGKAVAPLYDRVVIREDDDRRGRARGETAEILRRAVVEAAPGGEVSIVLDESEAIEHALRSVRAGEVVVFHYDDPATVSRAVASAGAVLVNDPFSVLTPGRRAA